MKRKSTLAPASLDMEQPEEEGYRHETRALAMCEPHLLGVEPSELAEHKRRRQQGIGKGAKANRPEMGKGSLSGT